MPIAVARKAGAFFTDDGHLVQFADQLAVKQASVSRWESGTMEPSVEKYIRMGNLADEADCIWFWERAGVDMKRIERWISARKVPSKRTHRAT